MAMLLLSIVAFLVIFVLTRVTTMYYFRKVAPKNAIWLGYLTTTAIILLAVAVLPFLRRGFLVYLGCVLFLLIGDLFKLNANRP